MSIHSLEVYSFQTELCRPSMWLQCKPSSSQTSISLSRPLCPYRPNVCLGVVVEGLRRSVVGMQVGSRGNRFSLNRLWPLKREVFTSASTAPQREHAVVLRDNYLLTRLDLDHTDGNELYTKEPLCSQSLPTTDSRGTRLSKNSL